MATRTSRTVAESSSTFSAVLQDTKLLDVRVFDEATKQAVYAKQTQAAEGQGQIQLSALRGRARREQEQRSISSTKWTPTTFPHGARAAKARPRTAKCSALPTIGPKVIDKMGVPQPGAWSKG